MNSMKYFFSYQPCPVNNMLFSSFCIHYNSGVKWMSWTSWIERTFVKNYLFANYFSNACSKFSNILIFCLYFMCWNHFFALFLFVGIGRYFIPHVHFKK